MPTIPDVRSAGQPVWSTDTGRARSLPWARRGAKASGLTVFQLLVTLLVIGVVVALVSVVARRKDDEASSLQPARPGGEAGLVAAASPLPGAGAVRVPAA